MPTAAPDLTTPTAVVNADGTPIGIGSYTSVSTVTRPNNATAYSAGQVVGAPAAAITFANIGPSGGIIRITASWLMREAAALIAGETSYTLHLYNVSPPSAFADGALFDLPSGDRNAYLGSIVLGTPVDLGATLYVEQYPVEKPVTLLTSSMFGYLVTAGAYTPVALAVHRLGLMAVRL